MLLEQIAKIIIGSGLLLFVIQRTWELIKSIININRFKQEIAFELFWNKTLLENTITSYEKIIENIYRTDIKYYFFSFAVIKSAFSSGIILRLKPKYSHYLVEILQRLQIVDQTSKDFFNSNKKSLVLAKNRLKFAQRFLDDLSDSSLFKDWEKKYYKEYKKVKTNHMIEGGYITEKQTKKLKESKKKSD